MIDIFENLNSQQLEAVKTTEGYVRVIAGAGSGKTKTLSHRFAYIVQNLGVPPNNILSITFTNKAAGEMKKRIRRLIGDNDTAYISTYHGLCHRILKDDISNLNYPKEFMIMDEEDQKQILSEIYEEYGLTVKDFTYKAVLDDIAHYKATSYYEYVPEMTNPDSEDFTDINYLMDAPITMVDIRRKYLMKQRKNYILDFNDLINFVLYLFKTNEEVKQKWQQQFEYIQVDEFQDISKREYELISILQEKHKNLFIVGDPDQTIYTWRGADINYILSFDKFFENTKTIVLNTNYRSSPEILNVSNSLIKFNKVRYEKDLNAVLPSNTRVKYFHAKAKNEECDFISKEIIRLNEQGVNYSDIAILYRGHYLSRSVEESLLRNKIRYIIYNGMEFYQRKEIKDTLTYLRMLAYKDDLSFKRIINTPARGVGKKRLEFLQQRQDENQKSLYVNLKENLENPIFNKTKAKEFVDLIEKYSEKVKVNDFGLFDLFDGLIKESKYEEMLMTAGDQERLDNFSELKTSIRDFEISSQEETTIYDYLNQIALITNADTEEKKESVKLMTVHTAKGLEFDYVFVCGLSEGIFPSRKTKRLDMMEEERRLAYVAFTRAKKRLYLTDSEGIGIYGGYLYPSRFIFNIKEDLYDREGVLEEEFVKKAKEEIEISENQLNNETNENNDFNVGDFVVHEIFGKGIVQAKNMEEKNYLILFEENLVRRTISFNFQGLKKIE